MIKAQKGFAVQAAFNLTIVGGFLYIVIIGTILGPMQDRREAAWRAFRDAKTVQTFANMYYYKDLDSRLEHGFSKGIHALQLLNTRVRDSGESLETGYPKTSIGHALSLSNRVLTGDADPTLLRLNDMGDELREREDKLVSARMTWVPSLTD